MGKIKVSINANLNIRKLMDQEPGAQTRPGTVYSPDM